MEARGVCFGISLLEPRVYRRVSSSASQFSLSSRRSGELHVLQMIVPRRFSRTIRRTSSLAQLQISRFRERYIGENRDTCCALTCCNCDPASAQSAVDPSRDSKVRHEALAAILAATIQWSATLSYKAAKGTRAGLVARAVKRPNSVRVQQGFVCPKLLSCERDQLPH